MQLYDNNSYLQGITTPKAVTPATENISVCKNILATLKHVDNTERKPFINRIYNEFDEKSATKKEGNLSRSPSVYEKDSTSSSKNLATCSSSKWTTEKEKFIETSRHLELVKAQYTEKNIDMLKNLNIECDKSKITKEPSELSTKATPGAVLVKKTYIEPPKVARVSRSFHGKSNTAAGGSADVVRRASEGVNLKSESERAKRKFVTQKSQPSRSPSKGAEDRKSSLTTEAKPRFTTTIVDEAEHAASVGLASYPRRNEDGSSSSADEKK